MEQINIDFEESIKKLNPVTWIYNNDPKETRQIGYIAEDLYEIDAFKYLIPLDKFDRPMGIRYDLLSVYAIEVLKTTMQKVEMLEKEILALKINQENIA